MCSQNSTVKIIIQGRMEFFYLFVIGVIFMVSGVTNKEYGLKIDIQNGDSRYLFSKYSPIFFSPGHLSVVRVYSSG